MKSSITAAPIAKAMPRPSAKTFRFSSSAASSSSSRTTELACSATSLTAAPTPPSVPRVRMPPPVDPLREHDPRGECNADDEPRARAPALRLRTLAQLRAGRREHRLPRRLVFWRFAPGASLDQARLHLPDQVGVFRERLGELRLHAAFAGELIRELLQPVRRPLDLLIRSRHFFVGGSSPVSVRQIPAAVRRETIVAAAPREPYSAVHSNLRSMKVFSTKPRLLETCIRMLLLCSCRRWNAT